MIDNSHRKHFKIYTIDIVKLYELRNELYLDLTY